MTEYTPWFPGNVKPVRVGIYQRGSAGDIYYSHWGGKFWGLLVKRKSMAPDWSHIESCSQHMAWRGLARSKQ